MNTVVAQFFLWRERIKSLYAAVGSLVAIVASVLLVAVGLPLQILTHDGTWPAAIIAGLAGALITALIENLTVKGCAALRQIKENIKKSEIQIAQLKAKTLSDLQQRGLPVQLPPAVREAISLKEQEVRRGSRTAYVYISLGVGASLVGNGLFWDGISSTLPWYYVISLTIVFSFIVPTILIDSELRSDLHKDIVKESMAASTDILMTAQDADAILQLHQQLHIQSQAQLHTLSTQMVLNRAATGRHDYLLDQVLGQAGMAEQFRQEVGDAQVIEATALQSLMSPNSPLPALNAGPLALPAPRPHELHGQGTRSLPLQNGQGPVPPPFPGQPAFPSNGQVGHQSAAPVQMPSVFPSTQGQTAAPGTQWGRETAAPGTQWGRQSVAPETPQWSDAGRVQGPFVSTGGFVPQQQGVPAHHVFQQNGQILSSQDAPLPMGQGQGQADMGQFAAAAQSMPSRSGRPSADSEVYRAVTQPLTTSRPSPDLEASEPSTTPAPDDPEEKVPTQPSVPLVLDDGAVKRQIARIVKPRTVEGIKALAAYEELLRKGEDITGPLLAKCAGISGTTAKKYLSLFRQSIEEEK